MKGMSLGLRACETRTPNGDAEWEGECKCHLIGLLLGISA